VFETNRYSVPYPPDSGQDSDTLKDALISLLSEKYGLRQHIPKNFLGEDEYNFGTEDQTACLQMRDEAWFTLEYYDNNLRSIHYSEQEAKRNKDEDEKKAALSKGL
jgi:hypothetical protein